MPIKVQASKEDIGNIQNNNPLTNSIALPNTTTKAIKKRVNQRKYKAIIVDITKHYILVKKFIYI